MSQLAIPMIFPPSEESTTLRKYDCGFVATTSRRVARLVESSFADICSFGFMWRIMPPLLRKAMCATCREGSWSASSREDTVKVIADGWNGVLDLTRILRHWRV